jgi:phenylalanyl-tRNA synthetase alpha chain
LPVAAHFATILSIFKTGGETMSVLQNSIHDLEKKFTAELNAVTTAEQLEAIRIHYLGRSGLVAGLMAELKSLSLEEKRTMGPELNKLKEALTASFEATKARLEKEQEAAALKAAEGFDVTSYQYYGKGSLHPYTLITQEIETLLISMGFTIVEGPEVETPWYNFEALNIPEHHPAREQHDTFWLTLPGYLLRTHTSSVQIHAMETHKPPMSVAVLGRTYRHEATDASHDFVFRQLECLVVDKNISMTNLIGFTRNFFQKLFNRPDLQIRVRSSFFPFVEPGIEIDISCPFCENGCAVCKRSRWIEIGGAGLVHPHVLKAGGIDPEQWSAFALGFGIERMGMLKYQIDDIRLFKSLSLDYLKQF